MMALAKKKFKLKGFVQRPNSTALNRANRHWSKIFDGEAITG